MLIYGFHPVREALRHRPHELARVWVAAGRGGGRRREIEALCRRGGVELAEVPDSELARLGGPAHNGFAAEARAASLAATAPAASAKRAAPGPDPALVVLVEDVQDPRNLGALLRVCEGAGVARVLVRDRGSAPISPAVVKTSAGAAEWLPVERIANTAQAVASFQRQGFWVYGVAAGGDPAWEVDLTGPLVLCFGGEEKGLRHRTREVCDRLVGLPMRGRVESLNLATAAAAVLYEAVRQRTSRPLASPSGSG
jgi:23S rRNA (guanosine2251-2'-O)-methyltransferase